MTRLVHLTDLHFGLHRADLVAPLRDAVLAARPDVIVASGDLSQRARRGQFGAAMAFLRGLGVPFMVIPGNHDVPLYNLVARWLAPLAGYRRGASEDVTPTLAIGRLRLYGINTADPFQWRGGIARPDEVERVCRAMTAERDDVTNILVAHHPFEEPPTFQRGETRGARAAMEQLAAAGLHVILSGHLHHWTVGLGIDGTAGRSLFQMQTGTALCAREGERDHGFAVLEVAPDRLAVTPWRIDEARMAFVPQDRQGFARAQGLWRRAP